eukprot:6413937-Prorocentrum_lima.AAC.1
MAQIRSWFDGCILPRRPVERLRGEIPGKWQWRRRGPDPVHLRSPGSAWVPVLAGHHESSLLSRP